MQKLRREILILKREIAIAQGPQHDLAHRIRSAQILAAQARSSKLQPKEQLDERFKSHLHVVDRPWSSYGTQRATGVGEKIFTDEKCVKHRQGVSTNFIDEDDAEFGPELFAPHPQMNEADLADIQAKFSLWELRKVLEGSTNSKAVDVDSDGLTIRVFSALLDSDWGALSPILLCINESFNKSRDLDLDRLAESTMRLTRKKAGDTLDEFRGVVNAPPFFVLLSPYGCPRCDEFNGGEKAPYALWQDENNGGIGME